jgi:putative ABC transport system permease protein
MSQKKEKTMADLVINKRARSGPAIWYRVLADLRGRRLPAGSVVLVVALATLLIGLSLAVFGSAQAPYERLFTQLNGAHLWVYFPTSSAQGFAAPTQGQIDAVIHAPGVTASTELEEATTNTALVIGEQKFGLYVQTFPTQQPAIGQLLITQGHELADADPDGVILNQQFADAQHLHVGSALMLVTSQGLVQEHVRGLAIDVNQISQNASSQATVYLLRSTFGRLYAQPDRWAVGLRLADPYAIKSTATTILQRLQAQGSQQKELWYDDWLSNRSAFASNSQLTAILLLVFGIVGLVAAGVIVANLVIGQVLAQQRDLGILKAVGFTPWQLVRTLVLEYLLLGLLGAIVGLVFVAVIAPALLAELGASLGVPVPPQYNVGTGAMLLAAILLVIVVFVALPAMRAGRIHVVDAIRPGGTIPQRGRARLAGLLVASRVSVVFALGIRGITARPVRAILVSLTLLLGVITAVFGLGLGATLDNYAHDPALNGIFADVYVSPNLYNPAAVPQLLNSRPEVNYYYSTYGRPAQLADGRDFGVLFTAGDTRRIAATLSSGRWFKADANELVVSQYALQYLHLHIGDRIPVLISLPGGGQVTITYTIVGALYMTQHPNQGYAPLGGITAHITSAQLLANTGYEVTLKAGVSPQAFEQSLQTTTADRIGVKVYDLSLPAGIAQGPTIMLFLSIALLLVAGIGMLNAMVLTTRERNREFATLKAVGLTPRQLLSSVVEGAVGLAVVIAVVGIPLGLWLTTMLAQTIASSVGGPPNIQISFNWWGLVLLIPATAIVAFLGAYLPARWAARVPAAKMLRYE